VAYPQIVNGSGCLAAHTPTEAAANSDIPSPMVAIWRRTVRLLAEPKELAGRVFKIGDFTVTPTSYKPIAHAVARSHLKQDDWSGRSGRMDQRFAYGPQNVCW